jgi:hypothetical protein
MKQKAAASSVPPPVVGWYFDSGMTSEIGDVDFIASNGASVSDGRLLIQGEGSYANTPTLGSMVGEGQPMSLRFKYQPLVNLLNSYPVIGNSTATFNQPFAKLNAFDKYSSFRAPGSAGFSLFTTSDTVEVVSTLSSIHSSSSTTTVYINGDYLSVGSGSVFADSQSLRLGLRSDGTYSSEIAFYFLEIYDYVLDAGQVASLYSS